MSTIDRLDWLVIREASRSASGVQSFTLHRRLSITASQLAAAIVRLSKEGCVDVVDGAQRIRVTDAGIARLQQRRGGYPAGKAGGVVENESRHWISRDKLEVNAPYIPRLDLL